MADFNKYYRAFVLMQETLKGDFTHSYIESNLADADTGKDELSGKNYSRVIDMDWVEAIEDAIPYIDKAIREQRRFIIQNEDIVPIEKARKITSESVRHLAQHTNLIARVEGDDVTPERILDIQREESFAIYENRFLRTLLVHASRFVDDRYKEMKHAPNDSYQKIHMTRHLVLNHQVLDFELTYANESHEQKEFDINADVSTLTDFQRVRRLRRVLADFSASPLIRALTSTEMVRPPIQRTNLMTKNPNFKKCLDLYLFITSYKKTGFEIVGKDYTGKMDEEVQLAMYNVMSYEHFVISIATNPALRRMLHEKYLEENARLETESLRPEEQIIAETEKRIAQVRAEEAQIRLDEIRDREKQINDLNSQLNHAKFTLRQYETKMTEMKGLINLHENTIQQLKDQIFEIEKEKKVLSDKVEELTAQVEAQTATIEAQAKEIATLKTTIDAKDAEIAKHLETIAAAREAVEKLKAECERLTSENATLTATVAAHVATIANLNKEVEELRDTVYKNAEEIGLLQKTVADRDATITQKNEEISSISSRLDTVSNEYEKAKAQFAQSTEQLKQSHQNEKSEMTAKFEAETTALTTAHKDEVATLKADSQAKLDEAKERHTCEVAEIRSDYDSRLHSLEAENKAKLASAAAAFEAQTALSEERHQKALEKQTEDAKKALENERTRHDKAIASERARVDKELDKKQREYDKALEKVRREAQAEVEKIRREAKAEIDRARRQATLQAQAQIKDAEAKAIARAEADETREAQSRHIGSNRFGFYFKKK
ncbi:MAG: hypothetical protein IJD93_06095 [Ruminococcus sp.]|nr:hypothetical protein [Ruminococcus sp.]